MSYDFDKVAKAAAFGIAVAASLPSTGKAALVINEVYMHGGSTSAALNRDYFELYNNGSVNESLNGLYMQYASATGNFNITATGLYLALPNVTLAPGQYFVVAGQIGGTTGAWTGSPLAVFDITSGFNMAAASGKLRIVNTLSTVGGSAAPSVLDYVGWGTANDFESLAAATGSFTTSIQRIPNGFDSNRNSTDFKSNPATLFTPGAANIPEPASLGLIASAGALLISRRRK